MRIHIRYVDGSEVSRENCDPVKGVEALGLEHDHRTTTGGDFTLYVTELEDRVRLLKAFDLPEIARYAQEVSVTFWSDDAPTLKASRADLHAAERLVDEADRAGQEAIDHEYVTTETLAIVTGKVSPVDGPLHRPVRKIRGPSVVRGARATAPTNGGKKFVVVKIAGLDPREYAARGSKARRLAERAKRLDTLVAAETITTLTPPTHVTPSPPSGPPFDLRPYTRPNREHVTEVS
jgi:hypothetical protein